MSYDVSYDSTIIANATVAVVSEEWFIAAFADVLLHGFLRCACLLTNQPVSTSVLPPLHNWEHLSVVRTPHHNQMAVQQQSIPAHLLHHLRQTVLHHATQSNELMRSFFHPNCVRFGNDTTRKHSCTKLYEDQTEFCTVDLTVSELKWNIWMRSCRWEKINLDDTLLPGRYD